MYDFKEKIIFVEFLLCNEKPYKQNGDFPFDFGVRCSRLQIQYRCSELIESRRTISGKLGNNHLVVMIESAYW